MTEGNELLDSDVVTSAGHLLMPSGCFEMAGVSG